jgi:hypothetical protein
LLADEFGAGRDDPLFPSLSRHGDLNSRDGAAVMRPMDAQSWSVRLRELARDARVFGDDEQRYERVSGHSLRRGFVTSALLAGHDPVTVHFDAGHPGNTQPDITVVSGEQGGPSVPGPRCAPRCGWYSGPSTGAGDVGRVRAPAPVETQPSLQRW